MFVMGSEIVDRPHRVESFNDELNQCEQQSLGPKLAAYVVTLIQRR